MKDLINGQPEQDIEHCATCIHAADSEDICILRRCKYAIAKLKNCYEPKQPEPPWIPIAERLPEEPGVYTVTNNDYEVVRYTFSGSDTSREYWERCVKAWLPMPNPYVED